MARVRVLLEFDFPSSSPNQNIIEDSADILHRMAFHVIENMQKELMKFSAGSQSPESEAECRREVDKLKIELATINDALKDAKLEITDEN
jgi:hypothetical protein